MGLMLKYVDPETGRIVHKHMTGAEYDAWRNAELRERLLREDLDKNTYTDRSKRNVLAWTSAVFFATSVAALKGENFTVWRVFGFVAPVALLAAGLYQVRVFLRRRSNERMIAVDKIMNS